MNELTSYTYKIIPPEGFVMPEPYITSQLPGGWKLELMAGGKLIKAFGGDRPSDIFNEMLIYKGEM